MARWQPPHTHPKVILLEEVYHSRKRAWSSSYVNCGQDADNTLWEWEVDSFSTQTYLSQVKIFQGENKSGGIDGGGSDLPTSATAATDGSMTSLTDISYTMSAKGVTS